MNVLDWNIGSITEPATGRTAGAEEIKKALAARADDLRAKGLRSGDRVMIAHGNSLAFFVDLLACWHAGACAMPVDPKIPDGDERRALIAHAGIRWIIDANSVDEVPSGEKKADPDARSIKADLLLYTSGSSGKPKCVAHSLTGISEKFKALANAIPLSDAKVSLCLLPTHFGHGLVCNSLFPLLNGCRLVILPPFDMNVLADLDDVLDREQVGFFSTVPAIWRILVELSENRARPHLKRVHCASAPLGAELAEKIRAWCGSATVKNVYGTTEALGWIAGPRDDDPPLEGDVGFGWGTEIETRRDDGIAKAKRGEEGIVWIRGPSLMSGYLGDDTATADAMKDGWFRTGDVGVLLEDGRLVLKGRRDLLINRAGMKVQPEEVELYLSRHPAIAECCVFAIPDDIAGELVGAAVVLKNESVTPEDIINWCEGQLSRHKIPSRWFQLDRLPRTDRGKIDRREIRRLCLADAP